MFLELDGDACSNTGVAIEAAVGNIMMACDLHIESGHAVTVQRWLLDLCHSMLQQTWITLLVPTPESSYLVWRSHKSCHPLVNQPTSFLETNCFFNHLVI